MRDLEWCDDTKVRSLEPYCCGVAAINSPHTGIVDWAKVSETYTRSGVGGLMAEVSYIYIYIYIYIFISLYR